MRAQAFVFAMGLKSAFAIPLKPEWQAKMAANDTLVAVDIPTTHNLERDLVMERDDNSNGHMTDCQYSIMLQITSYCETSSLKFDYGSCGVRGDGQGVTAGSVQFTSCSGSILAVCQAYLASTPDNNFCSSYTDALNNAIQYEGCPSSGSDLPDGFDGFCDAWTNAAQNDSAFWAAQDSVMKTNYFDTITGFFDTYKVATALAKAVMFDTSIQLSQYTVSDLAASTTSAVGTIGSEHVKESDWIQEFIKQRIKKLNDMGGAYAGTTERLNPFTQLLNQGDLNFDSGAINVSIYNSDLSISCLTKRDVQEAGNMSDCQYSIMLQITSYCETSSLKFDYGSCGVRGDGQGVTAGSVQFTSCSGSILAVCQAYLASTPDNNFCSSYTDALNNAIQYEGCPSSGSDLPDGFDGFCDAWTNAAQNDSAFWAAQDSVMKTNYFDTITGFFDTYHISTALAKAVMFDTSIQLSQYTVSDLAASTTSAVGAIGNGDVSESDWIQEFIKQRINKLNDMGGAYAGTTERLNPFTQLLNQGDLDFDSGAINVSIYNSDLSIYC